MEKVVDYYFATISPWTYLGHQRFTDIAARHGVRIQVKPADLGKVFATSGGLPLSQRPIQRQKYRMFELDRWRKHLGVALNLEPKFFPANGEPASLRIIAAANESSEAAMRLALGFMRAVWAEERNIADPATIDAIVREQGLSPERLAAQADQAATRYAQNTEDAIAAQVFGAPTYIYKGEPFWGQDRLDFLERAFAAG